MKLINLTNEGTKSQFTANLDGLKIKKDAKISLEGLRCEVSDPIIINAGNNTLEFSAVDNTKTQRANQELNDALEIELTEGEYKTKESLLNELTASLNAAVPEYRTSGANNYRGIQFYASLDTNKEHSIISYQSCDFEKYSNFESVKFNLNTVAPGQTGVWAVKHSGDTTLGVLTSEEPLSKSNNKITATLKLVSVDSVFSLGVMVTDSEDNPDPYFAGVYTVDGDDRLHVRVGTVDTVYLDNNGDEFNITAADTMKFTFFYGNNVFYFNIESGAYDEDSIDYVFDSKRVGVEYTQFYFDTVEDDNAYLCIDDNVASANTTLSFQCITSGFITLDKETRIILFENEKKIERLSLGVNTDTRQIKFTSDLADILGFVNKNVIIYGNAGDDQFLSDVPMPNYTQLLGLRPSPIIVSLPNIPVESYQNLKYNQNVIQILNSYTLDKYQISYSANNPIFIGLRNHNEHDINQIVVKLTDESNNVFDVVPNSLNVTLLIDDGGSI